MIPPLPWWKTRCQDRRLQTFAGRDSQAIVIEVRAGASLRPEHLVAQRIIRDAGNNLAVAFDRDVEAEVRNSVKKVQCPVEGVHNPAIRRVLPLDLT